MKAFIDAHSLTEDQRIELIGNSVMRHPSNAEKPIMNAFIVETHEKADRYIDKLKKRFPTIRIIDKFDGPTPGTVSVRVAGPQG